MIFETLPQFEGYRIGDDGTIWSSYEQRFGRGMVIGEKWRELKAKKDAYSYRVVNLRANGGPLKTYKIHRLVLEAFVGPCPEACEARHLDGDRENNRLGNLEWGTNLENLADKILHGSVKLSPDKVRSMRVLHDGGISQAEIARRFGVAHVTAHKAIVRKTWKHVA